MLNFKNEKKICLIPVVYRVCKSNELPYDCYRCICTQRVTSPSIVEQSTNW